MGSYSKEKISYFSENSLNLIFFLHVKQKIYFVSLNINVKANVYSCKSFNNGKYYTKFQKQLFPIIFSHFQVKESNICKTLTSPLHVPIAIRIRPNATRVKGRAPCFTPQSILFESVYISIWVEYWHDIKNVGL